MKNPLRLRACALAPMFAMSLALSIGATNDVKAQSQPDPKASKQEVNVTTSLPLSKAMPAKSKDALSFKSTFDHYKPYTDEKTASWRAANDEVGRIGGWRAYLKEANEPEPVDPRDDKALVNKPNSPATTSAPPPTRSNNPHAGHGRK